MSKRGMMATMLLAGALGSKQSPMLKIHTKDPLEGIDLKAEAELIKQKKSKLSASQRRRVLWELRDKEPK